MTDTKIPNRIIAFAETVSQLKHIVDFSNDNAIEVHVIGVTPEVDFLAQELALTYSCSEEYFSWDELCLLGDANSILVDELADIMDPLIRESAGNYPRQEWVSALAFRHTIKSFFDALIFRTMPVVKALQELKPTRVLCFQADSYNIGGVNPLDKPTLSLTTTIIPHVCKVYEIETLTLQTTNFCSKANTNPVQEVVPLGEPLENAINVARMGLADGIGKYTSMVEDIPVLFASAGLDGFTSEVLDCWQKSGKGKLIDSAVFFDWRIINGGLAYTNVLHQSHPHIRIICQEVGRRLWAKVKHNPSILSCFHFCDVDLSPVAIPFLSRLTLIDIPELLSLAPFVEHILKLFRRPIIMSGGMLGWNYLIGVAANELQVPFVSIHKGGFLGYSLLPMHEHYDMEMCDYFICNGSGAAETFSKPSEMAYWRKDLKRAIPIPLGATWANRKKSSLDIEKSQHHLRSDAKKIIYVMSALHGDNAYLGYAFHPQIWYCRFQQRLISFLGTYTNIKLILKPPIIDRYPQINNPVIAWVRNSNFCNVTILDDCRLTDVLDDADAFILDSPSTPLLDIISTDKPFIVYADKQYFRFVPDAASALNKRAIFTETEAEFFHELECFLSLPDWRTARPLDDEFLIRYVVHINDGNAAGRIADFLEMVVNHNLPQAGAISSKDNELHEKIKQLVGANRSFLPTQLAIETVRACNARCIMCPSTNMSRPHGVMNADTHKTIIDKVYAWGAPITLITHAGLGEPLLDSNLENKIIYEKYRFPSAQVVVYTNGSLLTEIRTEQLIKSGVDRISVSINGFRHETYERVMNLSRDVTYQNVRELLRIREKLHSPVTVQVSLVQTEFCSDQEVQEFRDFWENQGVPVITPPWISWGKYFAQPLKKEQFPCPYIWKVLMVDHDGMVKMCCEDYDTKFPLGNLLESNPDDIFNSYRLQEQRSRQLAGDFSWPEICRNCVETFDVAKDYWSNECPLPQDSGLGIHGQVQQISREISNILEKVPPEYGKYLLGHVLAKTLEHTTFEYPTGMWPPPTPAREYIRQFLLSYESSVHGRCVEFFPAVYKDLFSHQARITSYDVWNVCPGDGVTIVADLQNAQVIPDGSFDTIICTHVLSAIADPYRAARELYRIVKPGGLVLCTMPVILQKYAPDPQDFWRFTRDSTLTAFSCFSRKEIHSFGNQATVAGSPYYLMTYHFPEGFMKKHNDESPSIVAIAAWK